MGFENIHFATNEVLSSTKMNKVTANIEYVHDRYIPIVDEYGQPLVGYGGYIVRFALINPGDASGTGERGASYNRLWLAGNSMAIQVIIPDIFASTPYILGWSTHAKTQWGIIRCSVWDESATGFCVSFRDSGGEGYSISSGFGYTQFLVGLLKSS